MTVMPRTAAERAAIDFHIWMCGAVGRIPDRPDDGLWEVERVLVFRDANGPRIRCVLRPYDYRWAYLPIDYPEAHKGYAIDYCQGTPR